MARIWKGIGWFMLGLFIAIIVLPLIYKNKVLSLIKNETNKQINGSFDFKDLDISLIRSFPYIGFNLEKPIVTDLAKDTIFYAENLELSLNMRKLLASNFRTLDLIKIKSTKPFLNSKFDSEGFYNVSGLIKNSADTSRSPFNFQTNLNKIIIENGRISHKDSTAKYTFDLQNLNVEGNGKLLDQKLQMTLKSTFDHFNYSSRGISYLRNAILKWNSTVLYDLVSTDWSLHDNEVELNALKSKLDGNISSKNKRIFFDLALNIPKSNLKDLLSLVPGAFSYQFDKLTTQGDFILQASIQGIYDSIGYTPLIKLETNVNDGVVKYSQLPYSISKLDFDLSLQSLDSFGAKYKIKLPILSALLNGQPLSMRSDILYSNGYIADANGNIKALLKLADIGQMIPLEKAQYDGNIDIDLDFDFTESQLLRKEFDKMKLNGKLNGDHVSIKLPDYRPISIQKLESTYQSKLASIKIDNAIYGGSDLAGSISISNPLALITKYKDLAQIQVNSSSNRIDLNELTNSACDTCTNNDASEMVPLLNLITTLKADKINYKDFTIGSTTLSATMKHDSLFVQNLASDFNNSRLNVTGAIYNPYHWSYNKKSLTGHLNISSDAFDFNAYIDTTQISSTTSGYEKMIPPNTDLNIKFSAKRAMYNQYNLSDITIVGALANQTFQIEHGVTSLAGGQLNLAGIFSEQKELPEFDFKVDLVKLNIEQALKNSNFSKMAPLARFIGGIFSTSSVFQGSLDASMNPIWKKFDAAGVVEIINGKFSQFKPIEEITKRIQIPVLKNLTWEKSKNWFVIEKGIVNFKPFSIPNKEIWIQVEGMHEIEQNIDYYLTLGIPKKVFDKYKINPYVQQDFQWLRTELNAKGIPIQEMDTFYFQTNIKGHISNLTTEIKWIAHPGGKTYSEQLKEDLEKAIKQKTDSIKESIETKAESKKDSVLDEIKKEINLKKEELDSLISAKQDSFKKVAEAKTKELIDSVLKKETTKILDSTLQSKVDTLLSKKTKEEIEKINEKLKNWNPLKKKKN